MIHPKFLVLPTPGVKVTRELDAFFISLTVHVWHKTGYSQTLHYVLNNCYVTEMFHL